MSNAGSVAINVVADTTGVQLGMVQAATISERELKRIASYVKTATDAQKKMTAAVNDTAVSGAYQKVAEGAKKVESAHAGVNRELLVLTHEMSQGNFSRFGGSMLVLAERTNALEFAMSGAGAATLAIGGAIGGAAALMAMGAIEADKFAKSLQMTGNYAAVTEASIRLLADAQAKQTGQTPGAARGSIETAAGSGLFGPDQLAAVSRAMGDYQKLTRATSEEALKNFASIQDGVAKWAAEQNKSMHFLTLREYDHIKALEDSGQKQAAVIETLNAYAGAIETRGAPAVGSLARAWHAVADWASRAGQAMMDVGRPTDELVDSIAKVDREMQGAFARQAQLHPSAGGDEYLMELAAQKQRLEQLQFRAGERRASAATSAQASREAIEGRAYEESVLKQAKALSARTEALKKWDSQRDADAAAGSPMSAADYKAGVASINKQFTDKSGQSQANEYANLVASIKAFNQTTDEEVNRQGKLTQAQQFSIRMHEELTKAGRSLSETQRAEVESLTAKAAAAREAADAEQAVYQARLKSIAVGNAQDEAQRGNITGFIGAADQQANAIYAQIELIGKTAEQVSRIQALKKFDEAALATLQAADGDHVAGVLDVERSKREALVKAIEDQKQAQDDYNASFENGVNKAMGDYVKNAQNSAAMGEKVFGDAVNGMGDALATFAQTGKLSFKGLIDAMISDLIRMEIQKGFAAMFGSAGGAGGLFGAIGGWFAGSGAGAGAAAGAAGAGAGAGEGFAAAATFAANGIDYVPYDGFPAILHEGESVTRRQDAALARNSSAGISIHVDQSGASYGAGVDAAGVSQIARAQADRAKSEIMRALSTGRA